MLIARGRPWDSFFFFSFGYVGILGIRELDFSKEAFLKGSLHRGRKEEVLSDEVG